MKNQTKPLKALIASAVGVAAASLSFGAHASLANGIIDIWNVNVSTVFDTASVCNDSGDCTAPNGITSTPTSLSWGTGGISGLDIGSSPSSANVNTNGASVPNVSITHRNQPITGDTLGSVDIVSTLTLTPVSPAGPGLPAVDFIFKVHFAETPNNPAGGTCADGGANGVGVNINGCADIYVTDVNSLNFPFFYDLDGAGTTYAPTQYFISFFESTSGLNPLPAAACAAVGVAAPCLGFRTPESTNTTVRFASLITTAPVSIPEPATSALLGIGLLGGLLARRRRS